jgi:hypothetical protein
MSPLGSSDYRRGSDRKALTWLEQVLNNDIAAGIARPKAAGGTKAGPGGRDLAESAIFAD